jgi:hypothetical protein
MEAKEDPSVPERGRRATRHSQVWGRAIFYEQTIRVLMAPVRYLWTHRAEVVCSRVLSRLLMSAP